MKITGYTNEFSFQTKEGKEISGITIYGLSPLKQDRGAGMKSEKIFLSTAKLEALPFKLAIGQEICILYTRYGSIATLTLEAVDDADDIEINM